MRRLWSGHWLAWVALTQPVAASAQGKAPIPYAPVSPWNVHYADDSCRLARVFTHGNKRAILIFDQFEPGPGLQIIAAGEAFRGYAGRSAEATFGPQGRKISLDHVTDATLGEYGPAVMTGVSSLSPDAEAWEATTPPMYVTPPPPTSEQERSIAWFEIRRGAQAPIRFALGPMHQTMNAMRACTDQLLTHWGIDAAAHKTLIRRAVPAANPGTWVSNNDYPTDLVARGVQGLIQFRLSIDETGKVSQCVIQQSTRPAEFDKKVCQIMMKRARFDPALDAGGKPIKSYWRSAFRFQIQ